jgi:hypothetical protein
MNTVYILFYDIPLDFCGHADRMVEGVYARRKAAKNRIEHICSTPESRREFYTDTVKANEFHIVEYTVKE